MDFIGFGHIKVMTTTFGMDIIRIHVPSRPALPMVQGNPGPVEFPVPYILAFTAYTDTDPVGGYVAEFFVGRFDEYVETNEDGKIEHPAPPAILTELERVGEYDLIDYDGSGDYESMRFVSNNPANANTNSVTYYGPNYYVPEYEGDRTCDADYIFGGIPVYCLGYGTCQDIVGAPSPPLWAPVMIGSKAIQFEFYYLQWACYYTLDTDCATPYVPKSDPYVGLGSPTSGSFSGEAKYAYDIDWEIRTTSLVDVLIGSYSDHGIGITTFDCIDGKYYRNATGTSSGEDGDIDTSAYWPETGDFIIGVTGDKHVGTESIVNESHTAYSLGAPDPWCGPYNTGGNVYPIDGPLFITRMYSKIITTDKEYLVWEAEGTQGGSEEYDPWYGYFDAVDIFDYNGTPFYMYCHERWNQNTGDGFVIHGMVYQGKMYSVEFSMHKSIDHWAYHDFTSATYTDPYGVKSTITFPDEMASLYGLIAYKPPYLRAGKYNVE